MNHKLKKKISTSCELKIAAELLEKGYEVSKPISDDCRYDLVLDKGERLEKVQVKKSRWKNGSIEFNTASVHFNTEGSERRDYEGDIDCFMVYSPETGQVYRVNIEDAPSTEMRLRVKNCNQPHVNDSENYLLQ